MGIFILCMGNWTDVVFLLLGSSNTVCSTCRELAPPSSSPWTAPTPRPSTASDATWPSRSIPSSSCTTRRPPSPPPPSPSPTVGHASSRGKSLSVHACRRSWRSSVSARGPTCRSMSTTGGATPSRKGWWTRGRYVIFYFRMGN